jgi:hypothetical protein
MSDEYFHMEVFIAGNSHVVGLRDPSPGLTQEFQ